MIRHFSHVSHQTSIFDNADVNASRNSANGSQPIALIMAGGTGGHIYPGLAVAQELISRGFSVSWLGSIGGMEKQLVANYSQLNELAIDYNEIAISGVRGKSKLAYFKAPRIIAAAVKQAKNLIEKIQPAVVIGMGGFVSGPGAFAAWRLNIPVVIHEQNAVAGTTNKLASRFATRVLGAFPSNLKQATIIGNPVRKEIEMLDSPAKRFHKREGPIRVLVLGGSRGAQFINELVPQALKKVGSALPFHVIHQTGKDKFLATKEQYNALDIDANVVPYIEEMQQALEWADIAICRSGALTVCELTAAGLGAVFIPYMHAIGDHQTKNAEVMALHNAAVIKPQSELSPEIFAVFLNELLSNRDGLKYMAVRARELHKANAAQAFAQVCEELVYAK